MNRWFPELRHFPDKRTGRRALSSARRSQIRNWRFWICIVAYVVTGFGAMAPMMRFVGTFVQIPTILRAALLGAILGGVLSAALQWVMRTPIRRYLREQLVKEGVPICVQCGYDLTGNESGACPECGNEVKQP